MPNLKQYSLTLACADFPEGFCADLEASCKAIDEANISLGPHWMREIYDKNEAEFNTWCKDAYPDGIEATVEFDDTDTHLIIWSDDTNSFSAIACTLSSVLQHYDVNKVISFEYGTAAGGENYADGYGGGFVIIGKNVYGMHSTYDLLAKHLEEVSAHLAGEESGTAIPLPVACPKCGMVRIGVKANCFLIFNGTTHNVVLDEPLWDHDTTGECLACNTRATMERIVKW